LKRAAPGQFRKVDEAPFPAGDGSVKSSVYEWELPNPERFGKLQIRFLSPDGQEGLRGYYVEPVLRYWLKGEATDFFERACACGHRILSFFEKKLHMERPGCENQYRLHRALFRNRNRGHLGVGRLFNTALDFVDLSPGNAASVIAPGLGAEFRPEHQRRRHTASTLANELMREALKNAGVPLPRKNCRLVDVLAAYEPMVIRPGRPETVREPGISPLPPVESWPGRTGFDRFFLDGLIGRSTPWDRATAVANVASALIHGPTSVEDRVQAEKDVEAWRGMVRRLLRQLDTRSPRKFDEWLKNVREHGYLPLVGGTRLAGRERDEAAAQAERMFCVLMWDTYAGMARCYGALMWIVHIHFQIRRDPAPSLEERWLFRQWHFPQVYLAGLPLDFLEKPQLRWVIRPLRKLWDALIVEPDAYDRFTRLLGLYGALVRERRVADRNRKRLPQGKGRATVSLHALPQEVAERSQGTHALDQRGPAGELVSTACPGCRSKLQFIRVLDLQRPLTLVECYCARCDANQVYQVDLDQLAADHRLGGDGGTPA
jgi:hypothetical protein